MIPFRRRPKRVGTSTTTPRTFPPSPHSRDANQHVSHLPTRACEWGGRPGWRGTRKRRRRGITVNKDPALTTYLPSALPTLNSCHQTNGKTCHTARTRPPIEKRVQRQREEKRRKDAAPRQRPRNLPQVQRLHRWRRQDLRLLRRRKLVPPSLPESVLLTVCRLALTKSPVLEGLR